MPAVVTVQAIRFPKYSFSKRNFLFPLIPDTMYNGSGRYRKQYRIHANGALSAWGNHTRYIVGKKRFEEKARQGCRPPVRRTARSYGLKPIFGPCSGSRAGRISPNLFS
jgi:hypothetical protein